jgi:hypothetical protein
VPAQAQALHYASGAGLDSSGKFGPGDIGFNLADVSSRSALEALPNGVKGLVWLGQCAGVTDVFKRAVTAVKDHPNLWGYYVFDDAYAATCSPAALKAESDWIHANVPGAVVFVAVANGGSDANPSFVKGATYNHDTTGADLLGVYGYPCKTDVTASGTCDYDLIDRIVNAAKAAGMRMDAVVPVFQTFGGGDYRTDSGGKYKVPTADELRQILRRWKALVPSPRMDYAYGWNVQANDRALSVLPELQAVMKEHNFLSTRR